MKKFILISTILFSHWALPEQALTLVNAQAGQYEANTFLASDHLVTNLRLSKAPGKRPLLVVLAGSSGGFAFDKEPEKIENLLARGYHVLLPAYYFKNPPKNAKTPDILSRIRLESFVEQINEYVRSEKIAPFVDDQQIGILGTSKGGELALLLASLYPQFKFVVAVVPSNVAFQATNTTLFHYSAWTLNGQEIPYVPYPNFSVASLYGLLTSFFGPAKTNFTWMHQEALKNKSAVEPALIKVERINGPIHLISGTRDQWWPSTAMAREAMMRLRDSQFAHLDASSHVEYDADHFPLANHPEAWGDLLARLDQMVSYSKARQTNL